MKRIQNIPNSDLLFPFSFNYQDTKSPRSELSDHMHDYYEIVYVYKGSGAFFIDDIIYDMKKGDVFLIPNDTIHRAMPDKDEPVTSTIIFFSPTLMYNVSLDDSFSFTKLFENAKKNKDYKVAINIDQQPYIEQHLMAIHQETTSSQPGSRHSSLLLLHQIILSLYRSNPNVRKIDPDSYKSSPDWIKEILVYINDHLNTQLTLSMLADEALVSPSHFSRIFKKTTGIGLTTYLNSKRVIKAKQILQETNFNMNYIAEMCGFESMTHFHRIFKKYADKTPLQYRKEASLNTSLSASNQAKETPEAKN